MPLMLMTARLISETKDSHACMRLAHARRLNAAYPAVCASACSNSQRANKRAAWFCARSLGEIT